MKVLLDNVTYLKHKSILSTIYSSGLRVSEAIDLRISDNRIIKVDNDTVVFKWRDYKDNNKEKVMTLNPQELIKVNTILING